MYVYVCMCIYMRTHTHIYIIVYMCMYIPKIAIFILHVFLPEMIMLYANLVLKEKERYSPWAFLPVLSDNACIPFMLIPT